MQQTESFIRRNVQGQIPRLVDEIKTEVAKRVSDAVLARLVENPKDVEFDFCFRHFLVQDIKVIIDEEIASYMKTLPKTRSRKKAVKGAL